MNKYKRQISKMRKQGLSPLEMAQIRAVANQSTKDLEDRATRNAAHNSLMLTLAIPVMILTEDYWKKASKAKIHKFIEDMYGLMVAWDEGVVSAEEMKQLLTDYDIDIEALWKELDVRYGWDK